MSREQKEFVLKSGEALTLRPPSAADLEPLLTFFRGLPESERGFLRYDVTEEATLRSRLEQLDSENHFRLIVEQSGKIIGDATLDRELHAWTRHVAQIRGVVHPDFRAKGIASLLFKELTQVAEEQGIERLFAEVILENEAAIATLKQAGFDKEATLKSFAKDVHGRHHDLVVMTNDLAQVWQHLADMMLEMDLQMPG